MPIEQLSPELERIVSSDQDMEVLSTGYGTQGLPAEGPLWWREGGYLLFGDMSNRRIAKWAPGEGVTVFREPTGTSNGLTRDPQGRLVSCEHRARQVARVEPDGSLTVVAEQYQGKRLNRPNDLAVKSDGSIYFSDPITDNVETELGFAGVYRVSADLSAITLLTQECTFPNGLAFSPDESVLYVDDSSDYNIRAFDVQADGTLANGRVFCDMKGERPGVPDGMKVDVEGNVYCTGSGGLWIIDPSGRHLGTVLIEREGQATNCAWGGDDWKTLYITTFDALGRIPLKIAGIPVPG